MDYLEKIQRATRRKKAVIKRFQAGERQIDIAKRYKMHRQHVNSVLKQAGLLT